MEHAKWFLYVCGALAFIAFVALNACGGGFVERGDIGVLERVSVSDAQGDIVFSYSCTGTLEARECVLSASGVGLHVQSQALYRVPYVGQVGASLEVMADLDRVQVNAVPVVGPIRIDPASYTVERDHFRRDGLGEHDGGTDSGNAVEDDTSDFSANE